MAEDWMAEELARAKARLDAVNAEVRRFARGDARVHTVEGGEISGLPTVVVQPPAPAQVRVEGPVVRVPSQPPAQVAVRVERPVVYVEPTVVPAPQVRVHVEGPTVLAPRVEVHPPLVTVEPTVVPAPQVTVHVHMGEAVARLVEGLRGAIVINIPELKVPEPRQTIVVMSHRRATITHRVERDGRGNIVGSVEEREYVAEPIGDTPVPVGELVMPKVGVPPLVFPDEGAKGGGVA